MRLVMVVSIIYSVFAFSSIVGCSRKAERTPQVSGSYCERNPYDVKCPNPYRPAGE